jgi:hypothetical protein
MTKGIDQFSTTFPILTTVRLYVFLCSGSFQFWLFALLLINRDNNYERGSLSSDGSIRGQNHHLTMIRNPDLHVGQTSECW